MRTASNSWLLLVASLPTASATARMRIWRAFKTLGCVALRDGAYLLPAGPSHEESLQSLADECVRGGGVAWLMTIAPRSAEEAETYRQLFDRTDDYAEARAGWKAAKRGLSTLGPAELARLQKKIQREYEALRTIDFFPGDSAVEAEAAWTDLKRRIDRLLVPDEPHDVHATVPRLDASEHRGRVWATRRRLWVDRVASAWLIRRFIDPEARFRWLDKPKDCPKNALGFDFDGATFTHVDDRVTFETLMASFGLEGDEALVRLATIVHVLDVGGEPVAEASGFEAVMAGARERLDDDDALLAEIGIVLDSLYAHFRRAGSPKAGR